jgi:hypothetical protein
MKSTPFYLSTTMMPFYKASIILAAMLGVSSFFVSIVYALFTGSLTVGLILLLKGLALSATLSTIGFLAFWKKHQIEFENCKANNGINCYDAGLYHFA